MLYTNTPDYFKIKYSTQIVKTKCDDLKVMK